MPDTDNPAYYERAQWTAAGRADEFLKWLDNDEYAEFTGSTDSPTGWVGLILITRDMIDTWVSDQGDPWMSERRNFSPGWYIVRHDDNGFVWGLSYDDEQSARLDYAEAEDVYAAYDPREI